MSVSLNVQNVCERSRERRKVIVFPRFESGQLLLNGTIVKSENTFLQEEVKLSRRDAVVAAEHPFGLIPKILNAVDMIMALGK